MVKKSTEYLIRLPHLWCLAILFAYPISATHATTIQGTASVNISNDNIILQENESLSFGTILAPTTGNTYNIRVRPNGNYNTATINSNATIGNNQTRAQFRIFGDANQTVDVTSTTSSSVTGITFSNLRHSNTRTLNNNGQRNLNVGGDIIIDSSVVPGVYDQGELSYILTVEYQ